MIASDAALPVLTVRDLRTCFDTTAGVVTAVDGVSFELPQGQTVALVGESGSGKSVTSLSIMRLINSPGRLAGGAVLFRLPSGDTIDLAQAPERSMRRLRGSKIAMVFQEPMTALNPVFTVGEQIAEAIMLHQGVRRTQALSQAMELLEAVGIPEPGKRIRDYPHVLSGGMRQRVAIAIAISSKPSLLIADEPTTALDVTVQAQILDLLRRLQEETGMSILFITHNLGVVAELAHRVIVMYAGQIVEDSRTEELFARPKHPYTIGLLRSMPPHPSSQVHSPALRLDPIPGAVPSLIEPPPACRFEPRCSFSVQQCTTIVPNLESIGNEHRSRCLRAPEL